MARRSRFHGVPGPGTLFGTGLCAGRVLEEVWVVKSRLGQKLYLRIWLAIVAAVAVLTLVVGWLWQMALDHDRAERDARMARELVLRNAAGEVVGRSPARAVRVPGQSLEFQVTLNDGQTLYVQLPRPGRPPGEPRRRLRPLDGRRPVRGTVHPALPLFLAAAAGAAGGTGLPTGAVAARRAARDAQGRRVGGHPRRLCRSGAHHRRSVRGR